MLLCVRLCVCGRLPFCVHVCVNVFDLLFGCWLAVLVAVLTRGADCAFSCVWLVLSCVFVYLVVCDHACMVVCRFDRV